MDINKIADILNNNYKTSITMVTKGGIRKEAIVIDNGMNVQPTFYPYDYEGTEEEIAMKIISMLDKFDAPTIDMSIFESYESAKPFLRIGIRPKVGDNVVHHDYLNLDVYLYMQIDEEKSAKLNHTLMKKWDVSENVVWCDAINNTKSEILITSMREVMSNIMDCDIDDMPDATSDQIIIKNTSDFRASSALMMPDVLDLAASKLNTTNIVIIPSSIHELIVIADDNSDYDYLNNMVREVNRLQVAPEERLADHIYVYDTITRSVTCK